MKKGSHRHCEVHVSVILRSPCSNYFVGIRGLQGKIKGDTQRLHERSGSHLKVTDCICDDFNRGGIRERSTEEYDTREWIVITMGGPIRLHKVKEHLYRLFTYASR